MFTLVPSSRFRKDVKRAEKRGKDMAKLRDVLTLLVQQDELPPEYRDHALRGDWRGFRDLHKRTATWNPLGQPPTPFRIPY